MKTLSAILSGKTVTPLDALLEPMDPIDLGKELVIGKIQSPIARQLYSYRRSLEHRTRAVPPPKNPADKSARYDHECDVLVRQANTVFDVFAQAVIAEIPTALPKDLSTATVFRAGWFVAVKILQKEEPSLFRPIDVLLRDLASHDYDGDDGTRRSTSGVD